jgi:hypothetical protein
MQHGLMAGDALPYIVLAGGGGFLAGMIVGLALTIFARRSQRR